MITLRTAKRLLPLVGVAVLAVALVVLHRTLATYRYREIVDSLQHVPGWRILVSFGLTALNYLLLAGYERAAVRACGHDLSLARTGFTAFVAYAFSHNIGYAAVSGGAVRYRMYSRWGLTPSEIAYVILLGGAAFWNGFLGVTGVALLAIEPTPELAQILPRAAARPLGAACLSIAVAVWIAALVRRRPIAVRQWTFPPPRRAQVVQLLVVSTLDWAMVAGVIWVLLPPGSVGYVHFLAVFMFSQAAGMLSQVPGGLGVVEATLLVTLGGDVAKPVLVAAMILYRVTYYLVPFAVAAVLMIVQELVRSRHHVARFTGAIGRVARPLVPQLFAVLAFAAGAVLVFSGATPPAAGRLRRLADHVPLTVVEASHFLGSVAGLGLLLVARGLQLRLRVAHGIACGLLAGGALLSLLKGIDYEEAVILAVLLAVLAPARGVFTRRSALTAQHFTPRWTAAIATVVLCSLWLVSFCFKHVEYSGDVWWSFAFGRVGAAPRALRATVGATVLLLVVASWRLLRPALSRVAPAGPDEVARARAVLARRPDTLGWLALTGDKALLLDEGDAGFVMYGVRGRSWVAMGDPVAPAERVPVLVERFCALAREHNGWPVFYQVHRDQLPTYLDLGMALLKLGEEARVPLAGFVPERLRKDVRRSHRKAAETGLAFAVEPREAVPALMPELRAVSDAWLLAKGTREKGFSLGSFSERYLAEGPLAVVRRDGRIVAFADLWLGAGHDELSFDLMRFVGDEHGVMDFLMVELIAWAAAAGWRWLNLGMAPLAGIRRGPLPSLWNDVGSLLFAHGDAFYRFRGLRDYKEKFHPEWVPRYLACPRGMALPRILADLASLIGKPPRR